MTKLPELTWKEHTVKIKDLKEYTRNPRRISEKAFERLVSSIKEHGYNARILVDTDYTIIGGHQRKRALLEAGFHQEDGVQVLIPNRKLTESEFKRLNVRDNGVFGEFDMDALSIDFDPPELKELGVPEFYFKELEEDNATEAEESDAEGEELEDDNDNELDNMPEEPEKAVTEEGFTWVLGDHKLYCGDSLNPENYYKLLRGKKADFCFIDPPYGIKIDAWDNPIDIDQCLKLVDQHTVENSFFAFTHQMPLMLDWLIALKNTNFRFKDHIAWVKRSTSSAATELLRTHETLMIYKKGNKKYIETKGKYSDVQVPGLMFDITNIGGIKRYISDLHYKIKHGYGSKTSKSTRNKSYDYMSSGSDKSPELVNFTNVWSFLPNNKANRNRENRLDHPTIKPILLAQRLIELCLDKDEVVLDLFLGSGTTLIAAEESGRKCYGFELSPKYCDIIIKRWQDLTGKQAVLEGSDKTFEDIKKLQEV